MEQHAPSVVVIACGNTLRGDDGVAWCIGEALQALPLAPEVEVILTRQLMPEHAAVLRHANLAAFLDCSATSPAGLVEAVALHPAKDLPRIFTHHLDPESLLRLTLELYETAPPQSFAITVGGDYFELNEELSAPVAAAIPLALNAVLSLMPKGFLAAAVTEIPHAGKKAI